MQIEKNKKLAVIFWLLSVICMAIIFYFSSRTATESSEQSDGVLAFLIKLLGDDNITVYVVRKSAHMLEYTGLCLLINWAWHFSEGKKMPIPSVICTSLYAITDELHQLFVEGRSCEITDWMIDTLGAIIGCFAFIMTFYIVSFTLKRIDISKNK